MIYQEGYVYHIKDEYFEKVRDSNLMQNKEDGTYRPAFYCLESFPAYIIITPLYNFFIKKYCTGLSDV